MVFRTILVPVDFSSPSLHALQIATELARSGGSRLVLLYVAEPIVGTGTALSPSRLEPAGVSGVDANSPFEADDHPVCDARLEAVGREVAQSAHVLVDIRTRVGLAPMQIVACAHEEEADLIVMGTHGRRGLPRLLVGSVAERVLRQAPCPVLTLRWTE